MDDFTRQTEQTRRTLQEAIDSTRQAIEQTLDLIGRTWLTRTGAGPGSPDNLISEAAGERAWRASDAA